MARYRELVPHANILLTPDIVLSWLPNVPLGPRHGIIATFRQDAEKRIAATEQERLMDDLSDIGPLRQRDTHINTARMGYEERNQKLQEFISDYARSRLVVTDRLHGMILATITGTPCVAFDNSDGKVWEVYNAWLREVPFVAVAQTGTASEALSLAHKLLSRDDRDHVAPDLSAHFSPLAQALQATVESPGRS